MTDKEIKKSLNRIMSDPERKYVCGLENRIKELEAEIERLKRMADAMLAEREEQAHH